MRASGFFASIGALSVGRAIALGGQVLMLPIIARYLTPAEFGIAALATSITVFANMLSDGGMARSLIRKPLEEHLDWSSMFWALVVVGLALTACLAAIAGPVAGWLGEPAVVDPLLALSVLPLMLALNATFTAALEQARAFEELAIAQTVSQLTGIVVALVLAIWGWGVWALIIQQLVQYSLVAAWNSVRSPFRPRFEFSLRCLIPHAIFGRDIIAAAAVRTVGEQGVLILIARVLGTAELGLYAMASRFLRLPLFGLAGPLSNVVYVHLVQARDDPEKFREILLGTMRLLCLVILPPMVSLAMIGDTAFVLVLSDQWAAVAPIFALAALGDALRAILVVPTSAYAAVGRTGLRLLAAAEQAALWIGMALGGLAWGLIGIALARTLSILVHVPRLGQFTRRISDIELRPFLMSLVPGVLAALTVIVLQLGADVLTGLEAWWRVVVAALILATAMGVTALAFRKDVVKSVRYLRN
ncbi:MAG: oligosaccharide flippase family protein [Pseudomonadota bacterium]